MRQGLKIPKAVRVAVVDKMARTTEKMKEYDVIIAGASFAGLAVAREIKNKKVLLIDRKEIGTGVTSACGTLVKLVRDVNCEKSILQTFKTVAVHTKNKEIDFKLTEKYCTIDYKKFCEILKQQNNAKFLKANVTKVDDVKVLDKPRTLVRGHF